MSKEKLREALNATSYGMQEVNREIINVVSEYGPEGISFAEGKHPHGMISDREDFEMTAIRYNTKEKYLEAKEEEGDWFPVFTSLAYANFVDPLELADCILQQD